MLWQLATYSIKPRLNRLNGVSSIVVQGGQEPEFQIQPDPAKLVQSQMTVPSILDALPKSNLIDSPGLLGHNHQLVLALVSGQAPTFSEIGQIVIKTTPPGRRSALRDFASVSRSIKPVYTVVTANGKPAVLLNIYRQPDSNTVYVATKCTSKSPISGTACPPEFAFSRSTTSPARQRCHQERSRRYSHRTRV